MSIKKGAKSRKRKKNKPMMSQKVMMSIKKDALARIAAVLEEIERLKQSEFPYTHPSDAFDLLEVRFKRHQASLKNLSVKNKKDAFLNACHISLRDLNIYIPILGFVLRATNVRNAFEAYAPLQRLAYRIMGDVTKLIISSEWEFTPFVYRAIVGLTGFVLIGLPATESSNPLLIPLSGHELGHAVWEREGLSQKYEDDVESIILDELTGKRWNDYISIYPQYEKGDVMGDNMFAQQTWRPAYNWAKWQIEEIFCDFFAIRLFAESFLCAFAYLLSPRMSGRRSLHYPNIENRVSYQEQAAKKFDVSIPDGYNLYFQEESEQLDPETQFLISIADTVSASLVDELINQAGNLADIRQIPNRDRSKVKEIVNSFCKWIVPIRKPASLTDILNAGWECNMNEHLWENIPQIKGTGEGDLEKNRTRVLRDIILKSMEIAEIYDRLEKPL